MAGRDKPRVGVLYGGISSEREISLITGEAVGGALREGGYPVEMLDIREVPLSELARERMDVAFIALHGTFGEDGGIQAVLDAQGVPYTGSGVEASRLAMDKPAAKERFLAAGIPTPAYVELASEWDRTTKIRAASALGFPLVLKPAREGSSVGVVIVASEAELPAAIERPFQYDHRALAEEYIVGRELTVGILDDRPLPIIELVYDSGFFSYDAKYTPGATRHVLDPTLPPGVAQEVQAAALAAHECLGCRGCTRVDLRLGRDGVPYVLEVNTIPGMTAVSLLPEAAKADGLCFGALCEWTIRQALAARPEAHVLNPVEV